MKPLTHYQLTCLLRSLLAAVLLLSFTPVFASSQQSLLLPDKNEITAEVFGHTSQTRVLWIAPNYGFHPRHQQVARDLAKLGMEVWQIDLADALFLTRGANTMRNIPPGVVAEIIRQLSRHNHRLLIISSSYGSIPALRGVQQWQAQQPAKRSVLGVVLFSPSLYTRVPPLGQAPDFISIETSVPIYIFQAEKNSNRWHFPEQLQHLQRHATVFSEILKGVTSIYYDEDNSPATKTVLSSIARSIQQRSHLLARYHYALSAPAVSIEPVSKLAVDEKLKAYRGTVQPLSFSLQDVNGQRVSRSHFKGKVTIINFWASWCHPCVEEIPSLNRLRKKLQGEKFELISINYAESPQRVRQFMQQVAVNYPVLIDPAGKVAGQWQVVAFPSTFVIGPDGRIRYGVNAAIHWDDPAVIKLIRRLNQ